MNVTHNPNFILGVLRDLIVVLIKVKRSVELRLAHEQVLHARFVIEGLVGLCLIIGEGFPEATRNATKLTQGNFVCRYGRKTD